MTRTTPRGRGFSLYLDRAGLCTPRPTTDVIGHAETETQLYWLAKGASPFERGGALWARNEADGRLLTMADIGITQQCDDCGRALPNCERASAAEPCKGLERRTALARKIESHHREQQDALDDLESAVERRDRDAVLGAAHRVIIAYRG